MTPFDAIFARNGGADLDPLADVLARPRVVYPRAVGAGTALAGKIMRRRVLRAPTPDGLRPVQAQGLAAAEDMASLGCGPDGPYGIVAMVGCGHGKTLVAQLLPAVFGAVRPAVLMPAALIPQFKAEARRFGEKWRTSVEGVASYEGLSAPQNRFALDEYRPDLLIFDEAHLLGNPQSARWKRVARYLSENAQTARVCVLSGTLTTRSIYDMAHLFYAALRDLSPIPSDNTLDCWAACVDPGGEPSPIDVDYMRRLPATFGFDTSKTGFRRGFQALLSASRGVVVSSGTSADVSLRLRLWGGPPMSDPMMQALKNLEERWILPDGMELVDALDTDRACRQLATGHYTRWVAGTGHPEWFLRRKAWSTTVRLYLNYFGFESPALVERHVRDIGCGSEHAALTAWRDVRRHEPDRETVWVDGGQQYVRDCVDAYLSAFGARPDALIWYRSRAVADVLLRAGWTVHGAASLPPHGGHAAVAQRVHGKGWNGQAYCRQLVLEPMSGGADWEQLLARTHRPGQTRDVECTVMIATSHAEKSWHKARDGAQYVQDTTGEPQRLLFADREG